MVSRSLTFRPRYHRSPYPARRLDRDEATLHVQRCPACDASSLTPIATIATESGPVLERSRCSACTMVTFTRRPDAAWYKAFYDSAWDPGGKAPPDSNYDAIASVLLPFLPDRDARILEIGCGYGGALETMRRHGFQRLYGLEASPRRAEHARGRGFTVAHCSAEELTSDPVIASGAPYDAVFSWHVFEHLYDPGRAVENLASLLAPDGVVFVCVPHVDAEHLFFISHYLPHVHSYSERSMSALFERHGFVIEYVDDSLRLVARKSSTRKPAPAMRAERPIRDKFVRDFGLRELAPGFSGEAVLRYSPYRGGNEILEPSYGAVTELARASTVKRAIGRAQVRLLGLDPDGGVLQRLAQRTIGRKWNEVLGEVELDAGASSLDAVDHLRVEYPGREVLAYVK